jgi:hypothetical protein
MILDQPRHYSEEALKQQAVIITVSYTTRRVLQVHTNDPEEAMRQFNQGVIQALECSAERQIESVMVRNSTDGRVTGSR